MANSVALMFAMDTKRVPNHIMQQAEIIHKKQARAKFEHYTREQCASLNNVIIENLPSVNGLPLSAFLSRMRGYSPLIRHGMTPVVKLIEEEVAKLSEATLSSDTLPPKYNHHDKLHAIRNLCKIAANKTDAQYMAEWLTQHAGMLNEAVAASIATECRDLLQELCIGIAFLARQFRFRIYDKLEMVIAALVRTMAVMLIPWESYVEHYREAKERHNDLELARGRQILFHHPKMEYQFHEVNHRTLGYIYYTLGDLLFSCPSPKLIHFFECRIFRRKEMTRNILFTILHVVVINLSELRSEAERLVNEAAQPSSVSVPQGRSMTPLMSRRGKIYSETLWNELPANLYSDIIRVYNDRNRANKVLINEIMAILRSHAPEKLPLFEEATLKALEMYTGAGGGRLAETYQIGRPGATRDTEGMATGSGNVPGRRRKSIAQESMTGSRVSRMVELDQTDKSMENQSIETATSSSSDLNYSSDSTRQETRISRRTVIVPKLPELGPTTRFPRK